MSPSIKETVESLRYQVHGEPTPHTLMCREAAALIGRLERALVEVEWQLTNAQPHIGSIADRYGQDAIAYIDPHIDMAIEAARRALSGEPTP